MPERSLKGPGSDVTNVQGLPHEDLVQLSSEMRQKSADDISEKVNSYNFVERSSNNDNDD